VKYHLACLGGNNVSKCGKVPTDVKEEMLALLTKKTSEKEQKQKDKQKIKIKKAFLELRNLTRNIS